MNANIKAIHAFYMRAQADFANAAQTFREATVETIKRLQSEGLDAVTIRETLRVWNDEFRASVGKSKDRSHLNVILAEMLGAERKRGKNAPKDEIDELIAAEAESFDSLLALIGDAGDDDAPDGETKKKGKAKNVVELIVALVLRRDKGNTIKAAQHLESALREVRARGAKAAKK